MRILQGKSSVLADMGLFYSAAIWGSTFFVVKGILDDVDPVTLVAYRFLLAGLIMAIVLIAKGRSLFKDLRYGLVLAVVIMLLYLSQTIGLKYTTASNSGFITGLFVAFVPLFMPLIAKCRPTRLDLIATVVSLAGLWTLTGGMRDINIGDMLTLIAAVTYALHVLLGDRYMKAGIDPYIISCQQFLLVGFFSLGLAWGLDLPLAISSERAGAVILFLALLPTLSAFLIQMLAQRMTAPVKVSLIFALEPVFAALFAWTIGGESVVVHRALGGLLIFAALVIASFSRSRPRLDSKA